MLREGLPLSNVPAKKKVFKTFIPVGDFIALKVHQVDETPAGIVMPDGVADPLVTPTGTAIAVGPDCKYVKEGDLVLVNGNTVGINVYHGGSGKVFVIAEKNVVGVAIPPKNGE